MTHRTLVRALLTSAVLAAGVMLAGCDSDQISLAQNAKANQPVPPKLVAAMAEKDMDLQSPILVRLFKQEAELEVWKQTRSGQFALLKTYPICRWSGDLGPKVREGDRQAPEGFYSINPSQMNPQSAYYLSFNTGYPNAFDKSLGRTGSELMVHGDCSSRGCYAMTDEQIAEIYSLGRESFFGGQKAFQFQAYPFRMTAVNMAKHRNNPNMPFWKMIKVGNDHFEVTKQEPKVDFCEKKYVFDAAKPADAVRDPVFNASAKCPAYVIPEEIASAVREKEQRDDAEMAKLAAKGTPVARLNTGIDGGMNAIFASKIPEGNTGLSEGGDSQALASMSLARAPGTIPGTVNPPRPNLAVQQEEPVVATTSSTSVATATTPPATTRVASANASDKSEGFFSSFARKVGIGGTADASQPAAKPAAAAAPAKPKVAEAKPQSVVRVAPKAEPKAPARPAPKPQVADTAAAPAATSSTQLAGSAPVVQTNSFDTRFSAVK
ncbi:murein L,D-transpeptidase [Bradyrhizobium sp. CER78]|uniref:murein L,D-transpeptidase n=1 Tax=Bradyrhizobium sp. CER78 TaxID=3039162 RepID=UPI0024486666|nr:murein L,D-transpeptidase [Bradyrhizobium sp. CER78]MDH2386842.1 murein L,D-transpeptidase [Bradyrhizobium sp. CER78]